jgi:septal ring factor EnvC (AmiA/AmiB activator)
MKRPLAYRLPIRVRSKAVWLAVIVLAMLSMPAQSQQSRKELERQRKEKENEIKLTKKLLKETQAKHKETLQYLQTLNKQIRSREELIGTMQNEVHTLTDYIAKESAVVGAMDNDLAEMRREYGRVLYFMYKNRSSLDILSFVFSASSFNQAVKRYKFIRFYANYRQKQADLITRTMGAITDKVKDLRIQQSLKEQVVTDMGIQKQEWEQDKAEKDKLAKKLQGDENKLRKQLKEKEKVAAKLDKAIRDIIAKEIAAENKRNSAKTGNKTVDSKGQEKKTSSGELSMTPEMEKLSNEFASNRSRLPWPVEKGFISEKYGTHEHPTLDHVMVNNNGIKIRTGAGAAARCIFSGEVRNIIRIPGANISVIIKHGAYYTVYSNLASVNVKPGDKVSTKQVIGTVAENSINGETELELQIWKGSTKLDPEGWIYIR